jgi:hypothetical protein
LNVHGVNGVRQNTHSSTTSTWAKWLWGWFGYWKPKKSQITRYWSNTNGIDYGRVRTFRSEINKLIIPVWNKGELPEQPKKSIIVLSIKRTIKQILVIIGSYNFYQLRTNIFQHMQRKLLGIINFEFDVIGQLLIIYSAFVK